MAYYVHKSGLVQPYTIAGPNGDIQIGGESGKTIFANASRLFATELAACAFASGILYAQEGLTYCETIAAFKVNWEAGNMAVAQELCVSGWTTCGGIRNR